MHQKHSHRDMVKCKISCVCVVVVVVGTENYTKERIRERADTRWTAYGVAVMQSAVAPPPGQLVRLLFVTIAMTAVPCR